MKKILSFLLFVLLISFSLEAKSMTFEEAFYESNSKPMVVLLYADWADGYKVASQEFKKVEEQFSEKINFVELNIADKDAKFFNSMYHIYPNLPYVILLRGTGKVWRYLPKNCAMDSSCVVTKIKSFML